MHISKFRILNYKSFLNSGDVTLYPGVNVIVGQNNVGKTALVEGISLNFENIPHRSIATQKYYNAPIFGESEAIITFQLEKDEIIDLMKYRMTNFYIPDTGREPKDALNLYMQSLSDVNFIECKVRGKNIVEVNQNFLDADSNNGRMMVFLSNRISNEFEAVSERPRYNKDSIINLQIANLMKSGIYAFRAERLNVGSSAHGASDTLQPNASNLAEVLNKLQGNPAKFKEYNKLLNIIFPEISQVSVLPGPGNGEVQIQVWSTTSDPMRADLAMSLKESGTGIGQVLAILYIVMTAEFPKTIVIDEPQSFLHPGAIRKLLEILRDYTQHQFIITTHSPIAITAASPSTILMVSKQNAQSVIEPIDISETKQLRLFLSDLGVRLSDIFGADNILWVEGKTEEMCFPLIVSGVLKSQLLGTEILAVRQTGDFDSKHSKNTFEIYQRLSEGRGILPPAVAFVFDIEKRTQQERDDLVRQSSGKIHFLGQTMYENFLLNPQAIAEVATSIESFRDPALTAEEVQEWLNINKADRKYAVRAPSEKPFSGIHGAKLLEDIFKHFSENRVNYDKVTHGVMLTEWIIKNSPEDLRELANLLQGILDER